MTRVDIKFLLLCCILQMMKRKRSEDSTPNKKSKTSDNKPRKARGLVASMLHICNVPENILWSIIENFGCVKEINNFRLVCKQFVRATNMVVPCFAFMQTLIEDSKKYEATESQWITPLELAPLYLIDGKSMPSPTDAPLLALQSIVKARLRYDNILYLVPRTSCAIETFVSVDEETDKTIVVQSFISGGSLFVMTQTDDKTLQQVLDVTNDKPFILNWKHEVHSELIEEVCGHMEFEGFIGRWKPKEVTFEPIFNANQFWRTDALQKIPKLPASVFKLLMKKNLSETDELNLSMLLRAIEMLRWNVIYKFYQQQQLTKSDLLDLSTEDIKTLYDKLVITKAEMKERGKHPEFYFRFTGIDGDFHIRNKGNYRTDSKEFTLTFNNPVHYDCTSYLHLQRQLGFKNFLIASDFVDLLYKAVGGKITKIERNNTKRKDLPGAWMKRIEDVDPSCQVSDCRLEQSFLMCHSSRFYCLLQILTKRNSENDEDEFYCHVRFGKETKAMIYPHFIATMPKRDLEDATNSYKYWINALSAERFFELWCRGIEILPWLYCASLRSMTKEILAASDIERLKKLDRQLPDNQIVEYAKLNMKLLNNTLKPSHITKRLQIDYSNFYLWQLKVKLFEKNKDIVNAVRCLEVALDMLEDETEDIHEKLYFRHKFMKKHDKLKLKKYKSLSPEESLMLFIYHPESVAKANKFREKSEEFNFGLDLLEQAQGDSNAYLYPIEEITANIQNIRKFSAILDTDDELVKEIVHRDGFFMPDYFYRVEYSATTKTTASMFWYFTHPMNIPSILQNGINIRQGTAAYFYAGFMNYQIAEHQFGVDPFCVTTKNGNKFYAALLVEVDIRNSTLSYSMPQMPIQYLDEDQFSPCIQVGPPSLRGSSKLGDSPNTLDFETSDTNLVMVFDQSRIGAVRYFGIALKQDNSLNKLLNVSLRADYFKKSCQGQNSEPAANKYVRSALIK